MKRFLAVIALICGPVIASAQQAVTTLTFDGLPFRVDPTLSLASGFLTSGFYETRDGYLRGYGDGYDLQITNALHFDLTSIDLRSLWSSPGHPNHLTVYGFDGDFIDALQQPEVFLGWGTSGSPIDPAFYAHRAEVFVSEGDFTTVTFDWTNLRGVFIDSHGAIDPTAQDPTAHFIYDVDNVVAVVATPEPASLVLLATGLLGIGLLRRRATRSAG